MAYRSFRCEVAYNRSYRVERGRGVTRDTIATFACGMECFRDGEVRTLAPAFDLKDGTARPGSGG